MKGTVVMMPDGEILQVGHTIAGRMKTSGEGQNGKTAERGNQIVH